MHLDALIECDWTGTWRRLMDSAPGAETIFIGSLTRTHGIVTMWNYLWTLIKSGLMAVDCVGRYAGSWSYIQGSTPNHENEGGTNNCGWMAYSVYAVLDVRCTHCMLYPVHAVLVDNSRSWRGERERNDLPLCSEMMVELWTTMRDMGDEDDNDVDNTCGYQKSRAWYARLCWEDLVLA